MKLLLSFSILAILLSSAGAQAKELWTHHFELIQKDGSSKVISSANAKTLIKPASTLKLFVGWWAYQTKATTEKKISRILKESLSPEAETLYQKMGGLHEMEDFYTDNGLPINQSNFLPMDGSGLNKKSLLNCDIEIKLLKMIRQDKDYEKFKKLLARPGEFGTLETRLLSYKGKLFSKTGTLKNVAGLTGFLETNHGTVVFCTLTDFLVESGNIQQRRADSRARLDKFIVSKFKLIK